MRALVDALRHRVLALHRSGDRGTSLVEILVAMTIMTICGAIFTGAVIGLNRSTGKAQAATGAATQTNQAYVALDKIVRYAAAVATPARSTGTGATGDWYVELRSTADGTERCTQLRLDIATQQLQKRTWDADNPTAVTAFVPIASGFTNGAEAAGSVNQPFVLPSQPASANAQQLTINLVAQAGNPPSISSARSSVTFTAVNSMLPAPTAPVCDQVGRP